MSTTKDRSLSLDEHVRRLEDRQAIGDLVALYCRYVDERDIDRLVDLYTRNGAFEHGDGSVNVVGRNSIRSFYAERLLRMGPSFHYPHGHLVELQDGDHAYGWVDAHAEMAFGERGVIAALRYDDTYVREDGAWRFARRFQRMRYTMDMAELAAAYGHPLRRRWPIDEWGATGFPESLPSFSAFATRLRVT